MKYQLQPQQPEFDANGITIIAGWALIYNIDSVTSEYTNASYEYLPVGVSLPAYAFLNAPKKVDDTLAIVRTNKGWQYLPDHRGKTIYSTDTGLESIHTDIGNIPDNYTFLAPSSEFDSWDGEKWVLDFEKQHQHNLTQAATEKDLLIAEANSAIDDLDDIIEGGYATAEDKLTFTKWKAYRALLKRIDLNNAPDIDWPVKPV